MRNSPEQAFFALISDCGDLWGGLLRQKLGLDVVLFCFVECRLAEAIYLWAGRYGLESFYECSDGRCAREEYLVDVIKVGRFGFDVDVLIDNYDLDLGSGGGQSLGEDGRADFGLDQEDLLAFDADFVELFEQACA